MQDTASDASFGDDAHEIAKFMIPPEFADSSAEQK
jgi:hypothetical protein